MERWVGRVALVTGASSGIGAAIAKALVVAGMKVVACARREDRLKAFAIELKDEKGSLMPVKCDLTKDEEIVALFATIKKVYGGVDVCVNNAGKSLTTDLLSGTTAEWRDMMDVNVIAYCHCTKLAIASMRERGVDDGHIINVISICGHYVLQFSNLHFYTATKFALKAITEGLRQELREANSHIRASSISPGLVNTPAIEIAMGPETGKQLREFTGYLNVEDIAAAVLHIIAAPPHVEINDLIIRPTNDNLDNFNPKKQ